MAPSLLVFQGYDIHLEPFFLFYSFLNPIEMSRRISRASWIVIKPEDDHERGQPEVPDRLSVWPGLDPGPHDRRRAVAGSLRWAGTQETG